MQVALKGTGGPFWTGLSDPTSTHPGIRAPLGIGALIGGGGGTRGGLSRVVAPLE